MQYTQVVFPQALFGFSFGPASAPVISYAQYMPATASMAGAVVSPTWNPLSANAQDRAQWLPDTAGTLSYSQAMIAAHGLSGLAKAASITQRLQFGAVAAAPLSLTINGVVYLIDMSAIGQSLNLLHGAVSNHAKIAATPYPGVNATVGQNAIVMVNGEYYATAQGGVTGTTVPTFPVCNFTQLSGFMDGTVTWEILQFHTDLANGNCIFLNVASITKLYAVAFAFITGLKLRLNAFNALMGQIASALTSWASNADIALNSYLVLNGFIFKATTAPVPAAGSGNVGTATPTFNTSIGGTTTDGTVVWTCMGAASTFISSQTY